MTRIICLANSWKRGERCIAGINPVTGKWIRPVSDLPDGQVPKTSRLIGTMEPSLLDILEIPLGTTGPDFGFAKENITILPGKWRIVGRVQPLELLKFCSQEKYILHNDLRYVNMSFMQSLPMEKRHTLQLVRAIKLSVRKTGERFEGKAKWEGSIIAGNGQKLTATITDPAFIRILDLGYRPKHPCFVTVSLSMPWRPVDWKDNEQPCWKLIASVIELRDVENGNSGILDKDDDFQLPF